MWRLVLKLGWLLEREGLDGIRVSPSVRYDHIKTHRTTTSKPDLKSNRLKQNINLVTVRAASRSFLRVHF